MPHDEDRQPDVASAGAEREENRRLQAKQNRCHVKSLYFKI
jgi:hypothetical protein